MQIVIDILFLKMCHIQIRFVQSFKLAMRKGLIVTSSTIDIFFVITKFSKTLSKFTFISNILSKFNNFFEIFRKKGQFRKYFRKFCNFKKV